MTSKYQELIEQAYLSFNARDIDAILKIMHPEVNWPNGWEGGYVKGHDEVRNYWTRQWKEIDPHVAPVGFQEQQGSWQWKQKDATSDTENDKPA